MVAPVYSVCVSLIFPSFSLLAPWKEDTGQAGILTTTDAKFWILGDLRRRTTDSGIIPLCKIIIEVRETTLFSPSQPLDALQYFPLLPDRLGSEKPRKLGGQRRPQFAHYGSEVAGDWSL